MPRQPSEKEEFWRFALTQRIESGLSVRDFCRQEGLSEPSFYSWRRVIAQRDAELQKDPSELATANRRPLQPPLTPVKVTFAPESQASFAGACLSSCSAPSVDTQGLEITTPTGLKVRVGEACSLELIERTFLAIRLSTTGESSSC